MYIMSIGTTSQAQLLLNILPYMEKALFMELRNILSCKTLDAGYLSWAPLSSSCKEVCRDRMTSSVTEDILLESILMDFIE